MRRPVLIALGVVALVVLVGVGLSQRHEDKAPAASHVTLAQAKARLRGAPAPLAALHADASELLPATKAGMRRVLARLTGYPVVINKWASWCGPCRAEFPVLQDASVRLGKRVAFLGLNSGDEDAAARRFLRAHPVAYPSYRDPDAKIGLSLGAGTVYPTTIFIDARGRKYVHQGPYFTRAKLDADIRRYALS